MNLTTLLAASALVLAHPGSFSRSTVSVDGSLLRHSLRVQALTVIETLPIDTNDDLVLDEVELDAARDEILWYLAQNYHFFANGDSDRALRPMHSELELVVDGSPDLPGNYWIQSEFEYTNNGDIEQLTLEESLFETSNPQHIEYASVAWVGQEPSHFVFDGPERRSDFEPTGRAPKSLLRSFFELGVHHILGGWDHLLFLVALLVGVRSARALIGVITAFTLAHSLTLALAALELVSLSGSFVEIAIALSIVYVAAENLMKVDKRSLWIEAFVFGLLHGLGFASFLGDALRREEALLIPLLGFNLGVEAGQLVVVIPLALAFLLVARRAAPSVEPEAQRRLVPVRLGRLISMAVICIGLFWFVERAGFFGG